MSPASRRAYCRRNRLILISLSSITGPPKSPKKLPGHTPGSQTRPGLYWSRPPGSGPWSPAGAMGIEPRASLRARGMPGVFMEAGLRTLQQVHGRVGVGRGQLLAIRGEDQAAHKGPALLERHVQVPG